MANAAALIRESLWKDKDFRQLPRLAQCMYLQLLSQKDLDCSGVLTLHLELLAKGCNEMTVEDILADLKTLEEARYVFVDIDTDELLIRSYVRLVSVKSPNAWKSVLKSARLVESEKIRRELAAELRRLNRKDAIDLANEIDPGPNPSEPHSKPIPNPSEGDNPSERGSEPPSSVLVVGHLTSSSSQVGEAPPICPKHPENSDAPCPACKRRRLWETTQRERQERDELEQRRRLREIRDNCPDCNGTNLIDLGDEVRKCDHSKVRNA
ncbi:MAG TPA: hypothetical protein VHE33_20755 [Acidobacteriaceae bacterium]|nr:hypothetical protein [Acidobacteriaceae bacterium]